MRDLVATLIVLTSFCSPALADGAIVAPHAPAQPAFDTMPQTEKGCSTGLLPLSHAAYRPAISDKAVQCGRPLSTDTMLMRHHWDRT